MNSHHRPRKKRSSAIWFYPCTLAGYGRLGLLAAAVMAHFSLTEWGREGQVIVVGFLSLNYLLDMTDGYLARRFHHVSRFGAMFDLAIDLLTQTTVWLLSGIYVAPLLILWEWTTGLYIAAFSSRPASHWKTILIMEGPSLVRHYFHHQQRNWLSAYGNLGRLIFPLAWYLNVEASWIYYLSLPGLLLYEVVTGYMLYVMLRLLAEDGD